MDDIREEEEDERLGADDIDGAEQFVVFESNHPLATKRGGRDKEEIPRSEQIHAAARLVRNYGD